MSQDRRGFPDPGNLPGGNGKAGGGSVRRARERMEAGLPPEMPPPEDPYYSKIPQGQAAGASKRKAPNFTQKANPGGIGAAISKPSPMPQWPLRDDADPSRGNRGSPDPKFAPKGPPPQRPPRPSASRVPSILDSSKIQDYTPNSFPTRQQQGDRSNTQQQPQQTSWDDNNQQSPNWSSDPPLSAGATTISSQTTSSVGSIPDFPLPANLAPPPPPGPPRKYQNLGPPPAAASRRGASSYYSRGSFVSPIPEEFPEQLKNGESRASSKAIPSSWGSGPPESDILGAYDDLRNEDYDGDYNESPHDEEGPSLVRQASLGKRGKPSLRTINKNQNDQTPNQEPVPDISNTKSGQVQAERTQADGGAIGNATTTHIDPPSSTNNGHPDLRRTSLTSSSSGDSVFDFEKPPLAAIKGGRNGSKDINLNRLEKGAPRAMSDKRPGTKRPPRLDIDAVREAETRGSLTSLSDLIRRATKLATNLDRDKTASRLGMLDILNGSKEFKKLDPNDRRNSGTISDMLNSFPPPGLTTPTGEQRGSPWPGPFENSKPGHRNFHTPMSPGGSQASTKPRRRCCGMRPWVFALVCIIVMLLIAAAVVIPIVLIVLPRQREASQAPSSSNVESSCEISDPCLNGGVSILRDDTCSCVCVNGFGGDRCAITGDASCTTLNIEGVDAEYSNATVGNAIPRLLQDSQANFTVPLDAGVILDLFSSNSISCTSENALVSFDGASRRRSLMFLDSNSHQLKRHHHQIMARQEENSGIATKNGIVFAAPTTTTATDAPAATETGTADAPSRSDPSEDLVTDEILDFARVSILFILEQTRLITAAASAQQQIQSFFANLDEDSEETLGQTMGLGGSQMPNSFVLDFVNFRILLEDGTLVGGA